MIIIEDLLINIQEEKREKIINSAMKEFSKNTFEKASTNKIVADAGISKGLLFHYFGSKKKLFEYLEYFIISIVGNSIIDKLNWEQRDIFVRLKEVSIIKFKIFQRYPYLTDFSLILFEDETIEEICSKNPGFPMDKYSQIYTYNIDYSLFKEDVDIKKATNIIRWTIEKYGEEMKKDMDDINTDFDYKKIESEVYEYIDMLKICFYK